MSGDLAVMSTFLLCTERNASLTELTFGGAARGYTRSPGPVLKMIPSQRFCRLGATCLTRGCSSAEPITYCGVTYVYVRTLTLGFTFQSPLSSNPLGPTPGRRTT